MLLLNVNILIYYIIIFLVFKLTLCKIYILFIPFQIKFLCCALISATYKLILNKPIISKNY